MGNLNFKINIEPVQMGKIYDDSVKTASIEIPKNDTSVSFNSGISSSVETLEMSNIPSSMKAVHEQSIERITTEIAQLKQQIMFNGPDNQVESKIHSLEQEKLRLEAMLDADDIKSRSTGKRDNGLSFSEYCSDGTATLAPGIKMSSEPDPAIAVNYWASQGLVNSSNFIYPKDPVTGLSLGAWPKNYKEIPLKIDINKTYLNGNFIFPITPIYVSESEETIGKYQFVYEHDGIDLKAPFGSPIYSPVAGTIIYSEWGRSPGGEQHTQNLDSDETAYTVRLLLDEPLTINGKSVQEVYLTHMAGLRYRTSRGSGGNIRIEQGDLVGFVGNATGGESGQVGFVPHLHMTLYPKGSDASALLTTEIEKDIYGLLDGQAIDVGK